MLALCAVLYRVNAQYTITTDTLNVMGLPEGYYTLRVYVTSPNAADVVNAVVGQSDYPLYISVHGGDVWNHSTFGGAHSGQINCNLQALDPTMRFDSYVTIGDTCGSNNNTINVVEDPGANEWLNPFFQPVDSVSNMISIQSVVGGGWFVTGTNASNTMGDDLQVLLAQITTNGTVCGMLNLQIEDANGINTLHTGLSFGPDACNGNCNLISDWSVQQPVCSEGVGSIEAIPSGGYTPYSMTLNGVAQDTLTSTGLAPAIYYAYVEDSFGCFFQDTIEIESVDPIVPSGLLTIPITDTPGGNTDYYISGGTPPYSVIWSGPNGFLSNENNLPPLTEENQSGNYVITITDMNGCTFSESYLITQLVETTAYNLEIYPNPSCGFFILKGNGSRQLSITDLVGREVPFSLGGYVNDGVMIQMDSAVGTFILTDLERGWKSPIMIVK